MKLIKITDIELPTGPVVDLFPDSTLQKSGKPFFIPSFSSEFKSEVYVGFRMCRLGKNIAAKFASRYYDAIGLFLMTEAVDVREQLKNAEAPWALATAFDGAAIVGEFFDLEKYQNTAEIFIDSQSVEKCDLSDAKQRIDQLIEYVSKYFTMKIGDYVIMKISKQPIVLKIDMHITANIEAQESLNLKIK